MILGESVSNKLWRKKEHQDMLIKMWERLAYKYKDEPIIAGYDILNILEVECLKLGLDYNKIKSETILIVQGRTGYVSDETINHLYNACDVGLNTVPPVITPPPSFPSIFTVAVCVASVVVPDLTLIVTICAPAEPEAVKSK